MEITKDDPNSDVAEVPTLEIERGKEVRYSVRNVGYITIADRPGFFETDGRNFFRLPPGLT